MICLQKVAILICAASALLTLVTARPDSAGSPPLPGPGISYGGIPYGSMTGNVAEYFRRQGPSVGRSASSTGYDAHNYAPIEQWL